MKEKKTEYKLLEEMYMYCSWMKQGVKLIDMGRKRLRKATKEEEIDTCQVMITLGSDRIFEYTKLLKENTNKIKRNNNK